LIQLVIGWSLIPVDRFRGDTGDPVGRISRAVGRRGLIGGPHSQDRLVVDRRLHLTGAVAADAVVAVDEGGLPPAGFGLGGEAPAAEEFEFERRVEALRGGVDAPIGQDGDLCGFQERLSSPMVGHHALVDLAGQETLQAPDDVLL
jgi:hypothetical protein